MDRIKENKDYNREKELKPIRFFFNDPTLPEPERTRLIGEGKRWLSRLKAMQDSGLDKQVWSRKSNDGTNFKMDTSGEIDNVKIETKAVKRKEKKEELSKVIVYNVVYLGIREKNKDSFNYPTSSLFSSNLGEAYNNTYYMEGNDRTPGAHLNFWYGREGWESTPLPGDWEVDAIYLQAPKWYSPPAAPKDPAGEYGLEYSGAGGVNVMAICEPDFEAIKESPIKGTAAIWMPNLTWSTKKDRLDEDKNPDDGTYSWVPFSDKQALARRAYDDFVAATAYDGNEYGGYKTTHTFIAGPIVLPAWSHTKWERMYYPGWNYFVSTHCGGSVIFYIPDIYEYIPGDPGYYITHAGGTWDAFRYSWNSPSWNLVDVYGYGLGLVNGTQENLVSWMSPFNRYEPTTIFELVGSIVSENGVNALAIYRTSEGVDYYGDKLWTSFIQVNDYKEEIVKYDEATGTGGMVEYVNCLKYYPELRVFLYSYTIVDYIEWYVVQVDGKDSSRMVYGIVPVAEDGTVTEEGIVKKEYICDDYFLHTIQNLKDKDCAERNDGPPYYFFGEIDIIKREKVIGPIEKEV